MTPKERNKLIKLLRENDEVLDKKFQKMNLKPHLYKNFKLHKNHRSYITKSILLGFLIIYGLIGLVGLILWLIL